VAPEPAVPEDRRNAAGVGFTPRIPARRVAATAEGPWARIETGSSPSPAALTVVAPLGFDVTTVAVVERLDPARTVGIDMLIDDAATKRRVLATNPATRVDMRDAAHALFARDGKAVSVIRDSGGFVTQRVVSTIVNIATDICQQRICSPQDLETAVTLGWVIRWVPWPWGTGTARPTSWKCCSTCRPSMAILATAPAPGCAAVAPIGLSLLHTEE
jgi:3-hydroxybutyryl-CoA dehydrogenase